MILLLQGPIAIRMAKLAIDQGMEVRLHVTYLAKNSYFLVLYSFKSEVISHNLSVLTSATR